MQRKILLIRIFTMAMSLLPLSAYAAISQVPAVMSAPVVLYDEANNILGDGQYNIIITLRDSFGAAIYTEEQVVSVVRGIANLTIGEGYAVGTDFTAPAGGLEYQILNVTGDVSVEILVEGLNNPQELTILGTQPYSLISQYALLVADDAVTSAKILNGAITADDLAPDLLDDLERSTTLVVEGEDGTTVETLLTAANIAVTSDIGLNNATGGTVAEVLQGLDGAIDTLRGVDIGENSEDIATISADVDAMTADITAVEGDVDNLKVNVTTINGNIGSLETDMDGLNSEISTVATSLTLHAATATGVHAVTGNIVGTSDSQTLSNKALGATNSIVGEAVNSGVVMESVIDSAIARDSEVGAAYLSLNCANRKMVRASLPHDSEVYFAFAAEKVPSRYVSTLRDNLDFLKDYPDTVVVVEGHTDRVGRAEYNLDLGDRRARTVKAYFISQGVRPEQVVVVSYGEEKPKDVQSPAVNRRAVIKDVAR